MPGLLDVRRNPALLKLDLYCRGAHLDDSLFVEESGGRPIVRTRAGLGSGLELVLAGRHWVNVPVTEDFVRSSPYVIKMVRGRAWIHRDGETVAEVELAPRPAWYQKRTASGKLMSRVGTLQGTYLGVYPTSVCEFWKGDDKSNCHFCSVGLNLGADDATEKSVAEVVEVATTAVRESNVTYIDFNTGHYDGETYLDRIEPYVREVKRATGALIGLQTPPHRDLERYRALRKMGVNRVSFCFEIFDPKRFEEVCPGKCRTYGLKRYLEAVEFTARMGREMDGRGLSGTIAGLRNPWVVNGEIIAGLESPESSMKAIDWITSVGAIPTVCVFRPLKGTDYEQVPAPKTEDMIPIFARLYQACMARGLPIGVAPNVNVSLVLLPEECRSLVPGGRRYLAQRMKLGVAAAAFSQHFFRERDRAMAHGHGVTHAG